ncbi:MAG: response regulator, partial [Desulfobacteraceae bacterium]|nr:response regulator [Desulfobacteraceae bacterium]
MNIKILVVDDELVSRNKMLKIVEELGECYSTENGGQTLEFIKENPDIDLILLDILMPDMDGYELYAKLKKRYPLRDFNVIFVTALDKSEYEAKGLDLGGMDYITKPFSP